MNFFMGGDKWEARTQRYSVPITCHALTRDDYAMMTR